MVIKARYIQVGNLKKYLPTRRIRQIWKYHFKINFRKNLITFTLNFQLDSNP